MYSGFTIFSGLSAAEIRIQDIDADYLTGAATAIVLLVATFAWPLPYEQRLALAFLWVVRCGISLGAMLAFEAVYDLDAGTYYRHGMALNDPTGWMSFGDGTRNVIGIVGLLSYLTESFNAIKVIFSYISLLAVYTFYRSAVICFGEDDISILYFLGLVPSFLFWTSTVGKDPIVVLGIAIYCYGAAGMIVYQRMSWLVIVAIGLLIASSIRVWLGLIFITPLIATFVLAGRTSTLTKIVFVAIALPGFLVALQGFSDQFSVESTEDLVNTTQRISQSWAYGGSSQKIGAAFTSIGSMLAFMPIGLFTALFRPLPFEVPNIFGLFAGAENFFLLVLIVYGVARRGLRWVRQPVLFWAVATLIVWGAVYGFASYQNLGTAFRFRAQVTPILMLLAIYLAFGIRRRPARPSGLLFESETDPLTASAEPEAAGVNPAPRVP